MFKYHDLAELANIINKAGGVSRTLTDKVKSELSEWVATREAQSEGDPTDLFFMYMRGVGYVCEERCRNVLW